MDKVKPNVDGASETLLISLWSRAQVIKDDRKAKELVQRIDYDFSRFEKWRKLLKYTIARTTIFDTEVASFIAKHPHAVIVNIGAGLDTRFFRMDNGSIIWYELDLPNVIALRKQFFVETERYRFITASLTDEQWVSEIREKELPVFFIAEGVLMYLEQSAVKEFFIRVADHFPSAELLFEVVGPLFTKFKHPLIQTTQSKPSLKWWLYRTKELERWDKRLKVSAVFEPSDTVLSLLTSKLFGNKMIHVQLIQQGGERSTFS
jgi:methyltransferase (TIGR00027 family)